MFALLIAAVVASFSAAKAPTSDYATAYQEAQQDGKPLMVVVSAQRCPACVSLKNTTLRELESSGQLEDVRLVTVDSDAEPKLASQLMRGQMIPQIIVFSQPEEGRWQRTQLTGYQTTGTVRSLLRKVVSPLRRG